MINNHTCDKNSSLLRSASSYVHTFLQIISVHTFISYSPDLIIQPPTSIVVYPDTQAVFTCELSVSAFGGWFVNGMDIRLLSEELKNDISTGRVGFNERLTITARTHYNNTVVQCVAGEYDGSGREESDDVTLKIQGNYTDWCVHTCTYVITLRP